MIFFNRHKQQPGRQPKLDTSSQGYVFRRSRTLTGTTSPKVTASAAPRSEFKTARLQVHELHQLRRRLVRLLAVVLLFVCLLGYITVSYIGTIRLRYPQPGGHPATATYQQTIQSYFVQHPLERFGFAVNRKQLTDAVQAAHPELRSFDIDRTWYGGQTEFILQFRKPLLVWQTGGQRFYVDADGVAFEYDHFDGSYVAVNDQSGISPDVAGGAVASNSFINFLGKMVGAVDAAGKGNVTDIIIPASTREVDLKLQGRGYPIKTHTDRDPLQQAQDITSALTWFDNHKVTPQYIDVRVAGKAFFK